MEVHNLAFSLNVIDENTHFQSDAEPVPKVLFFKAIVSSILQKIDFSNIDEFNGGLDIVYSITEEYRERKLEDA